MVHLPTIHCLCVAVRSAGAAGCGHHAPRFHAGPGLPSGSTTGRWCYRSVNPEGAYVMLEIICITVDRFVAQHAVSFQVLLLKYISYNTFSYQIYIRKS